MDLFDVYIKELMEWNSRMNLTGITERGRIIIELLLDSLIPVPYLPSGGRMLDLGSGAGFPAFIIKILVPGLDLSMVDANSKRISFLKQVVRLLRLDDVDVVNARIEKLGDVPGLYDFDVVSARALADLGQVITWGAPLLSDKGMLLYFSGSGVEENIKGCEGIMKEGHVILSDTVSYHLPGMRDKRSLVILKKEL